jgi:hypothetical protein
MHVVLDAISGEETYRAVVHVHREVHSEDALNLTQDRSNPRIEIQKISGSIELLLRGRELIRAFLNPP